MGLENIAPEGFWARELLRASHETAQTFFPELYKNAIAERMISDVPSYCVRPWTPSGLGIFETTPTSIGGKFCIVGGNSTGGFAQAPSIAQAVISALASKSHEMHEKYHPLRARRGFVKRDLANELIE